MAELITYLPSLPWQQRAKDPLYGQCLAGVWDLTGGMASGRQAHAEELARRSITARGTCITDRDYGYDSTQHLYGRVKAADLSECNAMLTEQYRADDRTRDAQVDAQFIGGVLIIAAVIVDGDGPFPLTMAVSQAALTILQLGT